MESYLGKSENGREKEKKDSSTKNITTKGRKRRRSSSRDEEKEQEKNAEGEEEEGNGEADSKTKTSKGKTKKKQKVSSASTNNEERKLQCEIAKLFEELEIPYPSDIRVATLKKFITKESGRKPKPATKIVLMQEIIDLMKAKLEQQQ